eukprot:TRINITY_DN3109_c1_g1_i1.p1 TRINITY_DN3109_c1_g1~~TRINITY_DN3109_c1_g1_i1.p1  ORF type:complete len:454 (+),score=149.60 TRINITY_DN3109_c1_g1_i1:81-1442(+)
MVKSTYAALAAALSIQIAAAVSPSCAVKGTAYNDRTHNTSVNGALQADASACQALCKTQVACERFTWFNDTKACWLQGNDESTYEHKDAISGPVDCPGDATVSAYQLAADAKVTADKAAASAKVTADKAAAGAKAAADKAAADAKAAADKATADAKAAADKKAADAKAAADKAGANTISANEVPECAVAGKAYNDTKRDTVPTGGTAPDAETCKQKCKSETYCEEYTWYKNTKACWLQGVSAKQFENAYTIYAISGKLNCAPAAAADAAQDAAQDSKTAKDDSKSGFPVWGWVLIGLGVAALAGGAAMFMMGASGAKKPKKRSLKPTVAPAKDLEQASDAQPLMSAARRPPSSSPPPSSSSNVAYAAAPAAVPQPIYTAAVQQQAPSVYYTSAPAVSQVYAAAPAVAATSYTVAPAQYVQYATTAQSAFDALDRNGDGVLTPEELAAVRQYRS